MARKKDIESALSFKSDVVLKACRGAGSWGAEVIYRPPAHYVDIATWAKGATKIRAQPEITMVFCDKEPVSVEESSLTRGKGTVWFHKFFEPSWAVIWVDRGEESRILKVFVYGSNSREAAQAIRTHFVKKNYPGVGTRTIPS